MVSKKPVVMAMQEETKVMAMQEETKVMVVPQMVLVIVHSNMRTSKLPLLACGRSSETSKKTQVAVVQTEVQVVMVVQLAEEETVAQMAEETENKLVEVTVAQTVEMEVMTIMIDR